jgi:hypothetical protein
VLDGGDGLFRGDDLLSDGAEAGGREGLSGNFDGDKLEGTLKGNAIDIMSKDEEGGTDEGNESRQMLSRNAN